MITKYIVGNKVKILKTILINLPSARIPKKDRKTLREMIDARKNEKKNARLTNFW